MRAFNHAPSLIAATGLVLAGVAGSLLLSGCFLENDKTAGVDDFPNSIYARVDGFLDENKKAEGLESAPGTDSILIKQTFNGPPVKKAAATLPVKGLAKLAAGSSGAAVCPGFWTISNTKPPVGNRVTVDTLIICMDSLFLDTIKGNEHIVRGKSVTRDTVTGRLEIGEFTDADGDGFLNPIPGGKSKARLLFLVADKGITERTEMVVGNGPDDNFDTEADNKIFFMAWSKTAGADTLGLASFADADSDSVVFDNAKPSLVDLTWYAKGPTEDDKTALWSRFRMRTLAVYGVKKNNPVRFSAESGTQDGRLNTAVILALDGGETFDLKDTVLARFQAVGTAPADSVDTLKTTIKMKVGDFDDKTDDTTYALDVQVRKKLGEEVRALFDFKSDKPIPHGKEPEVGTLTMKVEYGDATTLEVEGKITEKTVDVTATLRDGKRLHAVWDRSGRGISLEHLD